MNIKKPSVYIVLLNYNTYEDTIECIKSLKNIDYPNYNIVIVDNNSNNNSQEIIQEYIKDYENIYFIQSGANLGFSGGNNIGIELALKNNADYVCLLNNDTIVEPDFLNPLVSNMENNKSIGITSGKIMYYDDKDIIWAAGGHIDDIKSIGCNGGFNCKDCSTFDEKKEVTFLTGCLQLISKEVFYSIGMYEEEYFLYMEDSDFCMRAQLAGFKLLYVPESKIYHKVSSSTGGEESPIVSYYMNRNRLLFNKKYQKNIIKILIFKLYFILKLIIDPIRKKKTYKYLLKAVKDHKMGMYGQRQLD